MDRTERRLQELIDAQDRMTLAGERRHLWHGEANRLRVGFLRRQIAADYRSAITALKTLCGSKAIDHHSVGSEEAWAAARDIIARDQGEG